MEVKETKKIPQKIPQISLTFKRTSPIEQDLYDHLQTKFYQGAYIKELLINQMFRERPDLVEKYNYKLPAEPSTDPTEIYDVAPKDEPKVAPTEIDERWDDVGGEDDEPESGLSGGLLATLGEFM